MRIGARIKCLLTRHTTHTHTFIVKLNVRGTHRGRLFILLNDLLIMNIFYDEWTRETVIINFFCFYFSRQHSPHFYFIAGWLNVVVVAGGYLSMTLHCQYFKSFWKKAKKRHCDFFWHGTHSKPSQPRHNRQTFIELIKFVNKHFEA